ncbi:hypothetical protein PNA2_1563 [Pyrococcus sp. NA2]|uniref:ATP-binding protein n=1 Tax=Pyrococcus sp. (strain NA2) TaxID=342949 RepID=UPI000209A934|nr:ATP-binding protein [Pyrococcus sp. NA2]AEC52478.1 hypothetical protein PNA2_1563 [Pyrococcus sp. NA2]
MVGVSSLSLKYAIKNGKLKFSPDLERLKEKGPSAVDESLFAVEFSNFLSGDAPDVYTDPRKFFRATYFTQELKNIIKFAVSRVSGLEGAPAILALDTTFGGGKTHTLIALYHLFNERNVAIAVPEIRELLQEVGISEIPTTKIISIDGHSIDPSKDLWEILGEALDSEELKEGPKDVPTIKEVIRSVGQPVLFLLDELVVYFEKIGASSERADRNKAFLHSLMVAVAGLKTPLVVITIPQSQAYKRASELLSSLVQILERSAKSLSPVSKGDIIKILKKRLVEHVDRNFANRVAKEVAVLYGSYSDTTKIDKLAESYPFNPELVEEVFFGRAALFENFQKTRAIMRIMAKTIVNILAHLDELPDTSLMISAGEIDLSEAAIRDELTRPFGNNFKEIVEVDIANDKGDAHAQEEDRKKEGRTRFGTHTRIATAVYLYSLYPEVQKAGGTPKDIVRVLADTSLKPGTVEEYLIKLYNEVLVHLWRHSGTGKYYFKPEVNPRALVRRHAKDIKDTEVRKSLLKTIPKVFKSTNYLKIHIFEDKVENVEPRSLHLFLTDYEEVLEEYKRVSQEEEFAGKEKSIIVQETFNRIISRMIEITTPNRNAVVIVLPDPEMVPKLTETVKQRIAAENLKKERKDIKDELSEIAKEYEAKTLQMLVATYTSAAYYKGNEIVIIPISSIVSEEAEKKPYSERIFEVLVSKGKVLKSVGLAYVEELMGNKVYIKVKELLDKPAKIPKLPYVPATFLKEGIKNLVKEGKLAYLKWSDGIPLEVGEISTANAAKLLENLKLGTELSEVREGDFVLKREYAEELIEKAKQKKADVIAEKIMKHLSDGYRKFRDLARSLPNYGDEDLKEAIRTSPKLEVWNGEEGLFIRAVNGEELEESERRVLLNGFGGPIEDSTIILTSELAEDIKRRYIIDMGPVGPIGPTKPRGSKGPKKIIVEWPEKGDLWKGLEIAGKGELTDDMGNVLGILALLNVDAKVSLVAKGERVDLKIREVEANDAQKLEDAARAVSEIEEDIDYTIILEFSEGIEVDDEVLDYIEPLKDTKSKKEFTVEREA